MQAAGLTGDPAGLYKAHIGMHMVALQEQREKQMAAAQGGK